jgi:hypothetical protein
MMNLDEFLDMESIKRQRVLLSYHLDAGDIASLVDMYTDDAYCEFGPYGAWKDRSTFAARFAEAEAPFYKSGYFSNLHVIANHWVELRGTNEAFGRVYLLDFVAGEKARKADNPLYWLGVYDEEYRKVGGAWKIARQSLNFVWPQRLLNDGFPGHLPVRDTG